MSDLIRHDVWRAGCDEQLPGFCKQGGGLLCDCAQPLTELSAIITAHWRPQWNPVQCSRHLCQLGPVRALMRPYKNKHHCPVEVFESLLFESLIRIQTRAGRLHDLSNC
jgi:hypothetical protein